MYKKHKIIIIIASLFLSLCIFNIVSINNVYAVGDGKVLNGNDANTGSNSNSGGSNNKPSIPKPQPPKTEWYDKISWNKQNSSVSWVDANNRLIVVYNQSTQNRVKNVEKDWHWVFKYGEKEGIANQSIGERFDKQQITFIAPKDGYYKIISTPRITETTYYYSRTVTTKYLLKEDTDGTYIVARLINREGEVPNKTVVSAKDVEQSILAKAFTIYLKQGQKFNPSPKKIIVKEVKNIDTNSNLVK